MAESLTPTWVSITTRRNRPWDEFLKAFADGQRCLSAYSCPTPDERHLRRSPGKEESSCHLQIHWDGRPLAHPTFLSGPKISPWHWIATACTISGKHSLAPRNALIASGWTSSKCMLLMGIFYINFCRRFRIKRMTTAVAWRTE